VIPGAFCGWVSRRGALEPGRTMNPPLHGMHYLLGRNFWYQACHSFFTAMASISTDTFRGRPATWMVERAGGCCGKNSP
jgi:hypothetical protein